LRALRQPTASGGRARRLALIHYTAPPVTGGVEAVIGAHARLLREAGHDVRLIAGRGDANLVPEADSRHPEVEAVARRLAAGDPARTEFAVLRARIAAQLAPLLADRDLVIAHNVLTMPFNLPLAAALQDSGRPLVAWTHDLAWSNPRYVAYRHPGRPWEMLHRAAAGVTYVAISTARRSEMAEVLGLSPRQIRVVPNGIDAAELWGIGAVTTELARRGGFGAADPLLLVPVRITRRKRIELALEASATLRQRLPRLRTVVSGPLGPHSADNLAYAADLIRLRDSLGLKGVVCFLHELGEPGAPHPVDGRAIADLYRMADVVILPSESEGFGLPLLEAALTRTPLVCADLPVLRELATGAITYPSGGGRPALVGAVERALRSGPARHRRGVARRFAWPAVLGRIEAAIEAGLG
ncbi:MAG: glycosyltransferase family 4 protein, partial [Candidatus Dormibacteraeota bacterium]|nr:glycosyltransferase family 4 protein [Candidatus Dormibacteraeota bacterium]